MIEHLQQTLRQQTLQSIYVTGPGKTGLIYTKYTCLYYGTYLLLCMCYPNSVKFIEFLMDFCIYDDILDMIQIADKTLLLFKLSKSGQILRVDIRPVFPGPVTYLAMHNILIFPLSHIVLYCCNKNCNISIYCNIVSSLIAV